MREPPDKHPPVYSSVSCGALEVTASSADSEHREILRGMISVGTFVVLGKSAAAVKEMVVAWRYGVSADVDTYLFLFNLVNWPISLWLGVLTSILVPMLATRRNGDQEEKQLFRRELTGRTIIAGIVVSLALTAAMFVLLKSSLTGLPSRSLSAAFSMLPAMALLVPLGWVIGLFSVYMLAAGRHSNTLMECVPAIVIAVLLSLYAHPTIEVLAWGTVAGFLCHTVCLTIPLRRELGTPRYTAQAPQWSAFYAGFSIMLLGQFVNSLTTVVDQFFAAHLSTGALASMGYAQRLLALILGLGATAVGRAAIPVLARSPTSAEADLSRITLQWVRIVFAGGLIAIVVGWWLAPWGVRLLFERGAFTAQDTHEVASVLRAGLVQLPFSFSAVLLFYALAGRRRYAALTAIAVIALLTKLWANSLLVPTWGIQGVMFGTGVMYAVLMLSYLYLFRRVDGPS